MGFPFSHVLGAKLGTEVFWTGARRLEPDSGTSSAPH